MEMGQMNKRVDKLENEVETMHNEMRVDMKELKKEMTDSIDKGFEQCREVMPLKCEKNRSKMGLGSVIAISSVICSTICGVILFLAKSGLLELATK